MAALSSMIAGFASLGEGIAGAGAARAQGDYQRFIAEINAGLAEKQAAEIEARGEQEYMQQMRKVRAISGSQRVGLAASGVDVGAGSAVALQEETLEEGAMDAMRIKNNAYKEAMGVRMSAISTRTEGEFARVAGMQQAGASLLTGGLRAAGGFAEAYGARAKFSGQDRISVGQYSRGAQNIKPWGGE